MPDAPPTRKLHLGAGRSPLEGWINLDQVPGPGIDVLADLNDCANTPLPFEDDTFDEVRGSHVLEHIQNSLPMMQELWRVARAGARAEFRVPYGSSDDAEEDPTHVRRYYVNSFGYFGQPFYWRADYGYRGDWAVEQITLRVPRTLYPGERDAARIMADIRHRRNIVSEMVVGLRAVKPRREALREIQERPNVSIELM